MNNNEKWTGRRGEAIPRPRLSSGQTGDITGETVHDRRARELMDAQLFMRKEAILDAVRKSIAESKNELDLRSLMSNYEAVLQEDVIAKETPKGRSFHNLGVVEWFEKHAKTIEGMADKTFSADDGIVRWE
jgi:hypothetical protein